MSGFLQGKNIAVTGAGRGIGRAIALGCAAEGANVVVNDYGVSMGGEDPTSEVADSVVEEIIRAGGKAVAVADSVATMEGGARIVQAAIDTWGSIDGVVCVAGILRERMLFNMTEEDWDPVIATHLKGTFTVVRAACAAMRERKSGSIVAFTSGAFAASVAQANYAAAKGGVVSLIRSAAAGMNRYGVNANCIAPVARTRMSENVPMDLDDIGEPEDVAALAVYLLSDEANHITGQIYTQAGKKIAVWNQPAEVRAMYAQDRWTTAEIAKRLDAEIGREEMPILAQLEAYRKAAAEKAKS